MCNNCSLICFVSWLFTFVDRWSGYLRLYTSAGLKSRGRWLSSLELGLVLVLAAVISTWINPCTLTPQLTRSHTRISASPHFTHNPQQYACQQDVDVVKLRAQANASMPASYNSNIQLLILILISNNNSDFRFHEFRC